MPVHERPFLWIVLDYAFTVTEIVLRSFLYFATGLAGPFIPTSKERQKPWNLLLQKALLCPFYMVGTLALISPAYTAFIFRYLLHQFRNPYHLSVTSKEGERLEKTDRRVKIGIRSKKLADPVSDTSTQHEELYSFSTMNLCLLPELGAKVNNLDRTKQRAKSTGERIIIDQFFFKNVSEGHQHLQNGYVRHLSNKISKSNQDFGKDVGVASHFSHLDFICVQEAFDRDSAKLLVQELHKEFPWVVYDVGVCGMKANLCGLNSGLMVASRYPVLDIDFKHFSFKTGLDQVCNKGLLMIKVGLPEDENEENPLHKVGYIFNTHLQAFQGEQPVIQRQLDNVLEWIAAFRQETVCPSEKVVFDVLCGDFNFDNLSPCEVHLGEHQLFSVYTDFCQVRPGKDKEWAIGTEMRIPTLQDNAVSTPAGLKKVLDDPYLCQQYMIDADLETATMSSIYQALPKKDNYGNIILSPVGGKRRIDRILYRKDCGLEVRDYHFVTRLASLTDHIPVATKINCVHA